MTPTDNEYALQDALNDANARIRELENELDERDDEIDELKQRISDLENTLDNELA